MTLPSLTFRIYIQPHSLIWLGYQAFFLLVNLLIVWAWPFYAPIYVRCALTLLIGMLSIGLAWRSASTSQTWSLLLNSTGRIVCFGVEKKAGWLTPSSNIFPGVAYLAFTEDITADKQYRLVFFDQITDRDRRRICRVLKYLHFQHSDEAD